MRVAVYSDLEYRRDGQALYAGESFVLFAARLADEFEQVILVGRLDPQPGRSHYRIRDDVEFMPLPHYAALSRPLAAGRALLSSLRAFRAVLERVDAVWLLGPHPLSVAFALMARRRGRRVVLGVRQDMPSHIRTRHPKRPELQLAALALEGCFRVLARFFPLVAVGPALARRYRGREVLPISVSVVEDDEILPPERAPARSYDADLQVLSVGRLDPEKNPLLLAEVLAQLEARDPRWRLVVYGDGSMEGALAERLGRLGVADKARLCAFKSLDGGLRDAYLESHAFLHVSWTEGVPQVLFEAFAAGLPVVATDVGSVGEVASGSALLVPPGDAGAAVDALTRLAADPGLRRRLIESGSACAHRNAPAAQSRRVAELLRGGAGVPA